MALHTANSSISLETKHPTEHCSLSCRACGSVSAPCSCLKVCSSCRVPHLGHFTLPFTTDLCHHGSCYSHVCKWTFLFQTHLPTSLTSSRTVLKAPTVGCLQWPMGSPVQCFSEQPSRAALWQLQRYARTQITHLNPVYLSLGK